MPPAKRKPGGWVLPGYKYLGPFNPLDNGEPVNKADAAARRHDIAYDKYIKEGKNPYLYFNKADQTLIDDLKKDWSFGGILASGVFKFKKAIAPELGGDKAERALKRKHYFANQNKKPKLTPNKQEPPAKQQKMADAGTSNEIPHEREERSVGGGGGGPGGLGGGKGSGVGISTGGWLGGSHFSDNIIVTKNTRQFMCEIKNGHLYKHEQIPANGRQMTQQECISTPWSYFNFNEYSCHFSPQDWQRLTNEYKRFRPRHMRINIYNLQIKQIVTPTGGGDPAYNNDLTAGVHIFCDGDHKYPYVIYPWDEDVCPELPYEVWKLKQYGYIPIMSELGDDAGGNSPNATEKALALQMPLFILENSDHEVLRTGEQTEFTFDFDCEWVNNERAAIPAGLMYNPMIPTKRAYARKTQPNGNQFEYKRFLPYDKPTGWMPGPGLQGGSRVRGNDVGANLLNMTVPPEIYNNSSAAALGCPIDPTLGSNNIRGTETVFRWYQTPEGQNTTDMISAGTTLDMLRDQRLGRGKDGGTTDGVSWDAVYDVWMFPNQVWDRTPITRYSPIWCKQPRADKHTLIDPMDGSLAMDHPPGTIFIKMAKIPIPGNGDSYLNVYCTGQVSCEIVWEVERYHTKNWRPERRHTALQTRMITDKAPTYSVDGTGKYMQPDGYDVCMPTKATINKVL